MKILRDPDAASRKTYDLVIIGGGIHGATLSLEATRRGLRPLLLEKGDFGGATSFNSLRILHGGLRYLQTLDLKRFIESVGERHWFLSHFPRQIKPLPCLMPLYGEGLRRPFVLRNALLANDILSVRIGIPPERRLPGGKVITAEATREMCSLVDTEGLKGAAIWYDAFMPDSQRILMDVIRWACEYGATSLNYVEACGVLKTRQGDIRGVIGFDHETGEAYDYSARVVVNAAGPWCRKVAAGFDRDEPNLFRSSIAWNVLFDRNALSSHAIAVAPRKPGGRTYFIVPWKGKLLAGTGHAPWYRPVEDSQPVPSAVQMEEFLDDLNLAVPGIELDHGDILHVFSGLLPATEYGSTDLTVREVIHDHARHGGPKGLYSVSGIKFTTARLVAVKTLNLIFPNLKPLMNSNYANGFSLSDDNRETRGILHDSLTSSTSRISPHKFLPLSPVSPAPHFGNGVREWKDALTPIIEEESVQHLEDLVFRRTNLWETPRLATEIAPIACDLLDWDDFRSFKEIKELKKKIGTESLERYAPLRDEEFNIP